MPVSIEHGLTQQQFASEAINMMFAHGADAPNNAFDRVITEEHSGDEGTDGHLSVSGWTTTGETERRVRPGTRHVPICEYGIGNKVQSGCQTASGLFAEMFISTENLISFWLGSVAFGELVAEQPGLGARVSMPLPPFMYMNSSLQPCRCPAPLASAGVPAAINSGEICPPRSLLKP